MIQYQVRPITRYVVTRYEENGKGGACETRGEYDNHNLAYEVAYAMCKLEHDKIGLPVGSMEIIYPDKPNEPQNRGSKVG
jgi:hypothetical protein